MSKRTNRQRNLLHDHPLLRKGGVHQKTLKAKRRKEKQDLRKAWVFPNPGMNPDSGKPMPAL
jgi:hypothetical protein